MSIKTFMDKIGITYLINKINELFVHKNGDEDINGVKTIKNSIDIGTDTQATALEIRNPHYTRNVQTLEESKYKCYSQIVFGDNSDNSLQYSTDNSYVHGRTGMLETFVNTRTGETCIQFAVYRHMFQSGQENYCCRVRTGYELSSSELKAFTRVSGQLILEMTSYTVPLGEVQSVLAIEYTRNPSDVSDGADWNGTTWEDPLFIVGTGGRYNQSMGFGSAHGETIIVSGEVRGMLKNLDTYDIGTNTSAHEDILVVSNAYIYLFTQVNQETGTYGGKCIIHNNSYYTQMASLIIGDSDGSNHYSVHQLTDHNAASVAETGTIYYSNKSSGAYFNVWNRSSTSSTGNRLVGLFYNTASSHYEFKPTNTNVYLGAAGNERWQQLYATTTTIATSDERYKDDIIPIANSILDIWDNVEWYQFKFKESINEKGDDNARNHTGVIAQQIKTVFDNNNLDISKYGFFCHDTWDASEATYKETVDGSKELFEEAKSAGDQYSIRYEELLCIEAAYLRRENQRLKEELNSVKSRLAAIEAKLNMN